MQALQRISSRCVLPIVTQLLPSAAAGVAACTCHTASCHSLPSVQQQPWQSLDLDTAHAHLPWSHLLQQTAQQDGQKQSDQQDKQKQSEQEQHTAQQQQQQHLHQEQQQQQQQDGPKEQQAQPEQQQEQGSPHEDQPVEGPDGLLAEWRVSSSQWLAQYLSFMVSGSLQYTLHVTWAQLYEAKPAGSLGELLVWL
jgi:hypothetical protein